MSTTWLYAGLVAVIVAAIPTMLWLKRAGEREWARHVSRRVSVRLVLDATRFTAALAAVGPVLAKSMAAAADFDLALQKVQADLRATRPTPAPDARDNAGGVA